MQIYYGSVTFQLIKNNALQAGVLPVMLPANSEEEAQQTAIAHARQSLQVEIIVRSVDLAATSPEALRPLFPAEEVPPGN